MHIDDQKYFSSWRHPALVILVALLVGFFLDWLLINPYISLYVSFLKP